MKSIDILFLLIDNPHNENWCDIPLGFAHLAGQAKAHEISYKIIDFYNYGLNKKSKKVLRNSINSYRPRVIGISSSAYNLKLVKREIERIRTITKRLGITIPIILGGYICLIDNALQITDADVLCYSEGEITFIELMNYYLKKENALNLPEIKGIMFKSNGGYIRTPPRELITDLDSLAFPDYDIFYSKYYRLDKSFPIYTQRGCYNNCTFCDIVEFYGKQYIRRMSPERIIELIKIMKEKHNFKIIDFMDDNFLNSSKFLSKFFNLLEKNFLKNGKIQLALSFQTRADDILRMKELLIKYKLFLSSIQIGVESFVQSQLDRWNKNIKVEQNIEANQFLSENDIPYVNYFLWIDRETTIKELEENVNKILNLPSVPVQMDDYHNLYSKIPNFVFHEDFSAIYNKKGVSTVKDIPFLHAARTFLKKTEDIADTISVTYIEFKKLSYVSHDDELLHTAREFFRFAEYLMKKRLFKMLDLAERVKNLSFQNKTKTKLVVRNEAKSFISTTNSLIKPFLKFLKHFCQLNPSKEKIY